MSPSSVITPRLNIQRYRNNKEIRRATSPLEVPLMFTNKVSERDPDNVTFLMIAAMRYVVLDVGLRNVFGQAIGVSDANGGWIPPLLLCP